VATRRPPQSKPSERRASIAPRQVGAVAAFIAVFVALVWGVNVTIDALSDSYSASPSIHFALTLVEGVILGRGFVITRQSGDGDG
jgi:hypothetical protein